MKNSRQTEKLEQMLRSSTLVVSGFMGSDNRSVNEIIDADASEVSNLGFTNSQIAQRMQEIVELAKSGLGSWVTIDKKLEAQIA